MKYFQDVVNTTMQEMINDGRFEAIIESKLEKTIEEAINEVFRSHSDFGKDLTKHIKDSLKVEMSNVNLQEYGHTVLKMVEGLVNKHVQESAQGKLLKQLNELFDTPPALITLEQLLEDFKLDEVDHAHACACDCCGLVIESSEHKYVLVGFNPSVGKSIYKNHDFSNQTIEKVRDCEIQLHFEKQSELYKIKWVNFGGYRHLNTQYFMPTLLHGTARRLFQMYCSGTMVSINSLNAEDYETAYSSVD